MKRTVFAALMTLIVGFAIATPVAHAQMSMTANIPFGFSVGQQQLSAGSYVVRDLDRATLIESKDGEERVVGIYQYAGPSKPGETKLVFHKVGDHYFLCQIWSSVHGQGLQIPESKLEKELLANNSGTAGGGTETVIVALR